jgi:hypothetical protein
MVSSGHLPGAGDVDDIGTSGNDEGQVDLPPWRGLKVTHRGGCHHYMPRFRQPDRVEGGGNGNYHQQGHSNGLVSHDLPEATDLSGVRVAPEPNLTLTTERAFCRFLAVPYA